MSKATLYIDEPIHDALRLKSVETHQSMSHIVNEALQALLSEDIEDIRDWRARRGEKSYGYEEFLKQLESDGTI